LQGINVCVEPANIVKDIPQEIEYIRVYTQYRKPKTAAEKARYGDNRYLCPNAIRFEDSTTLSILQKQMKKVEKRLKRIPVDNIDFVPKVGDKIVCGIIPDLQPPATAMTIMSVEDFRYGSHSVQHWEVTAK
jgi:hypothetical protein